MNKLSRLQRWIHRRALQKPDTSKYGGCDLLTARVMAEYYETRLVSEDYANEEMKGKVQYGSQNFKRSEIGKGIYNSRKASISKAFACLEKRGLAVRVCGNSRWAGINLTEQGIETANTLATSGKVLAITETANTEAAPPPVLAITETATLSA